MVEVRVVAAVAIGVVVRAGDSVRQVQGCEEGVGLGEMQQRRRTEKRGENAR